MAVYLVYPLILLLLFYGSKPCKKGEWNEDYLSLKQTKAFLGFCAVLIMFHHISQKTCASYLQVDPIYLRPGLDFFVYVGYLCVAMFFFCSGYGMYVSSRKGAGFFDHYIRRRLLPLLIPTVVMWLVFFFIEKARGMTIQPPVWLNVYDYIWFIPAILYIYIAFYVSFRLIKNERVSFITLWCFVIVYFIFCKLFSPGTWWYNTQFLFAVGAMVGADSGKFTELNRKHYPLLVTLCFTVTVITFAAASYYEEIVKALGIPYDEALYSHIQIIGQMISSLGFIWFVLLAGMKVKIGNPVLSFLGGLTLEIYLVHPLFVHLFAFDFVQAGAGAVYYISNQLLYIAAVMIPSIPIAYALHKVVALCSGKPAKKAR